MEVKNVGGACVSDSYSYPETQYTLTQPCVKCHSVSSTKYKLTEDTSDDNYYTVLVGSRYMSNLKRKKKPVIVAHVKLFIPAEDVGSTPVLQYIQTKVLSPYRKARVYYCKHEVLGSKRDDYSLVKSIISRIGRARKRDILEFFDKSQKTLERILLVLQKRGEIVLVGKARAAAYILAEDTPTETGEHT